ncbi:hypothetical protein IP76_09230 [Rhizobium sp. AAP43]|nr:hypothetical protein IP76_09230 [Rhizobium sp. AAP43]
MEIFPVYPVGKTSLKVTDTQPTADARKATFEPLKDISDSDKIFEDALSVFASMTPRRLREIAAESYQRDEIDEQTYRELATELPLQAVDRNGNVTDLSNLTDDTNFDYAEYFRTQQSLAEMIGDMDMADSYTKVLDFFSRTS